VDGPETLAVGDNLFRVYVTAESGDAGEYRITVTRVSADTIEITTADDLAKIGGEETFPAAGKYLLCEDLTLENWTPIAAFSGDFEGGGKTIVLNSFAANIGGTVSATGLFGSIRGDSGSARSSVRNLAVHYAAPAITVSADYSHDAGVLAGSIEISLIENISLTGTLTVSREAEGSLRTGGIGGYLSHVAVTGVTSSLAISATGNGLVHTGGIGGYLAGSSVTDSVVTGSVSVRANASNSTAAGIAGFLFGSETTGPSSVNGCAATGNVSLVCSNSASNQLMFYAGGVFGYAGNGTAGSGSGGVICGQNRYEGGEVYCGGVGYPYAGGVAGYNYTKSVLSQSYSSGKVTAENNGVGLSYAGGIAGYNSRESIIEDCYSFMEVWAISATRTAQAGGIAGANAAGSTLRRCYAAGEVNARVNGAATTDSGGSLGVKPAANAGGIAGALYFNASSSGNIGASGDIPNRLENCVALNSSVNGLDSSASGGAEYSVYRIAGDGTDGDMIRSKNYAWADMPLQNPSGSAADKAQDGYDGDNCNAKPGRDFYATTLGWNFTSLWKMGDNGYPVLINN
jgi:hypothetical protein